MDKIVPTMSKSFLQFDTISKRFPGVQALDEVTFAVAEASVHGLVGENGAGKSTLLKTLSGYESPDDGLITLADQTQAFHSPARAIEAGIAVIYQELNNVPEMSVAENLLLGQLPNRAGWIDKKKMYAAAKTALALLEEDIDPSAKLGSLPIAQRQMVEIAKALMRNAKVIAFDEPTSSLTEKETRKLFSIIKDLKSQGKVIIYVSHRLEEIFQICDSVTILRDGRRVQTFDDISSLDHDYLVRLMTGRDITDIYHYSSRPHGQTALEIEQLAGPGLSRPANLTLACGEILGLFGLVGAGRTEFLKLICGAQKPAAGTIKVRGKKVQINSPRTAIDNGITFCPEDRILEGIIPAAGVSDNINISTRRNFSHLGFIINEKAESQNAQSQITTLDIKTPSLKQPIRNLSGGNQQKAILARWLSEKMAVLLLDEPTRGIDVGTKTEIYSILYQLAQQGIAIIVASSELPEVLGISDRIIVMRQGRIVCSLDRPDATEEKLLNYALPVLEEAYSNN
jgi:L-arabinose transport system ATP-binding protein